MSFRNRDSARVQGSGFRVQGKNGQACSPRSLLRAPRSARRGVLLLVVLSLLVLFMLIGTAFLMSSNQYRRAATESAKNGRLGNFPTKSLDRAVMQILRDTGNKNSVARSHSLLRDLYGSEGFEAVVYSPNAVDLTTTAGQATRFAAATTGVTALEQLGPTQGQLIDVYVRELAYKANDPLTLGNEANATTGLKSPDARHVLKLEPGVLGLRDMYNLPLTKGYFNGCLLTITSGPANGQSTRVVDYEYIGDLALPASGTATAPFPQKTTTRMFRFRVMAIPRSDGSPLVINQMAARRPEISDLAGATFIVNGRPFNGTGVGFNELTAAGQPRLNAVETVGIVSNKDNWLYPEIALMPNSAFFFASDPATSAADEFGARYRIPDPGTPGAFLYPSLNPKTVAIADRPLLWKYQTFVGPGDADESYDAPDFQNMPLAMQTVTPRSRGRVVQGSDPLNPVTLEVDSPAISRNQFLRLDLEDLPLPSFHRPDLENYWFHRLVQFAMTVDSASADDAVRAVLAPYGADGVRDASGGDDPGVSVAVRDQIVAIKRKVSLRPLSEDHPNFDGSNPASRPLDLDGVATLMRGGNITIPFHEAVGPWDVDNDNDGVADSVWVDLGDPVAQAEDGTLYKPLYAFLIVDLDSRLNVNAHGLVDDLESPQLDSTIVSGAGPGNLSHDLTAGGLYSSNYLATGSGYGPADVSLRPLFPLWDYRDAGNRQTPFVGGVDRDGDGDSDGIDDYAALLVGRAIGSGRYLKGRYGLDANPVDDFSGAFHYEVAAGITSTSPTMYVAPKFFGQPDRHAQLDLFGYPWDNSQRTAFSNPPDMMARYAVGLDYAGQPVNEVAADVDYTYPATPVNRPLLADSPYELDLSGDRRRDSRVDQLTLRRNENSGVAGATEYVDTAGGVVSSVASVVADTDDAPFATAELERILRAYDADAGVLPDRLWNIASAFDPLKLLDFDQRRVAATARTMFGLGPSASVDDSQMLVAAQQMAGATRRLVTTDSYDLPTPGGSVLSRLVYGADGQPGVAGDDDDGNGTFDDPSELGWQDSDDYEPVMEGLPPMDAAPVAPRLAPDHPTIADLLKYRVQYERRKRGLANYTDQQLSLVAQQFLAPELIAGQKLDLNRPFGDGSDNGDGIDNDGDGIIDEVRERGIAGDNTDGLDNDSNGQIDEPREVGDIYLNGVVDDPLEAGEPFVDHDPDGVGPLTANGIWDTGEEYYELDGNGQYTPPRDTLWQGLTTEAIGFSYNHGGVVTDGRMTDVNNDGDFDDAQDGRLRYNGIIQRQTQARHLYCLMLLLMDENYVASQNVSENAEGNINLKFMYEQLVLKIADERGRPGAPTTQDIDDAKALALQKLTARRIAQWAINCVDYRDADAIMTPFEYDENPFDGWGTYDPDDNFIAIDGDPGTDENWGIDIPYPKKFDPKAPIGPTNLQNDPNALNSTRGMVWGVERPELLITETLALHDRRCTDEEDTGAVPPNLSILSSPSPGQDPDYDLDQRLKPRGSMFLELYNPWSTDGDRPAELYGQVDVKPGDDVLLSERGVMLNRLSSIGVATAPGQSKRSPVWRVAVVQDPINGRLSNQIVDIASLAAPGGAADRDAIASQFLTTDVDGFGFDSDNDAQRLIYFTTGRDYVTGTGSDVNRDNDNELLAEYQDIVNGVAQVNNPNLNVWVPPLPYRKLAVIPGGYPHQYVPSARRYFIARKLRRPFGSLTPDEDTIIAPILPGRYAVVGSSGVQMDENDVAGPAAGVTKRFVTPLSRLMVVGSGAPDPEQLDSDHLNPASLLTTRRIELWPNLADFDPAQNSIDPRLDSNIADPEMQQLLIGENGGPEIVSRAGGFVNVTDENLDGEPDSAIVDPCVAIPVEDMNISEPVEGYPTPRYVEMFQNPTLNPAGAGGVLNIQDAKLNSSGELAYDTPYDRPLDLEDVLVRNGTTPNYRSVHLQRLANPMFPWNPPKYDADGKENALHRPELPINPYLTIDSQSADLTAYNGASQLERTNMPVSTPSGTNPPGGNAIPTEDLTQSDYFAPLSAGEFLQSPDHVLAGLIDQLTKEDPPIVSLWTTVESYRGTGGPDDERRVANDLTELERRREGDLVGRRALETVTEWGWHRLRRVLPDDTNVAPTGTYNEMEFKQRLNLKSLERGAHYLQYYKWPQPGTPEGWWLDTRWEPRLLWKQERPNAMLFLRGAAGGTVRVTDMKNARSRRMLQQRMADNPRQEDHFTQDEDRRNNYLVNNLQLPQHVLDFALEQTLGFANEVYAPDLDRASGGDESAMLMATSSDPKPGAPEVTTVPASLVAPQDGGPNPWNTELNPWNTIPEQKVLLTADVTGGAPGELQRREKLTKSTYPWLAWNNRPFVSAEELTQVPASSSSLMLREYSIANRYTANPYDGDGLDSSGAAETTSDRLARQQGCYGHLLNFFQSAERPAGTYPVGGALEPLSGGPNFYRLLEFVEVPSRFVGTDTMLSPEIFNDPPDYLGLTEVGTNITALDDPRLLLQPPFNKVSRERDPGRVNLNTVVGRRIAGDPASSIPTKIWSEVYDGIMHRYQDNNLLDATNSVLQLSHFGPAWRDVVLSRRGYAQYVADPTEMDPVEKLDLLQIQPETFAFGLNRDFPSVFSNPFRSADAGDLVPLANMVRPSVDATWLRGHHWQRADDNVLITNPFAQTSGDFDKIAWGIVGVDDDGNGIVDDVREAGYGTIDVPGGIDGDTLRIQNSTKALESSGIPLFSESLPEPAIDAERNPGMMYQPMTRLGNLVTTRSNVYAIWVTVGYFEVERAPDWNANANNVQQRFGGDGTVGSDATVRARALYDRVYPEGYTLGEELGTDTGNTKRQRAFYIIDRTEPVGFKPGEDLNVDKMIRVRRRIE